MNRHTPRNSNQFEWQDHTLFPSATAECIVPEVLSRYCARVVSKVTLAGDGRSAALAGSSLTGAGGVAAPGAGACTNTVATAPVALAEPPSSTSLTMSTSAMFLSTNENNFVNLVTDLDPSKASLH